MNNRKKLMIDMDDVITLGGFLSVVNEYLGTNYTENDNAGYFFQDLIPDEKKSGFGDFFHSKNLYEYTTLAPDVVETMKYLNDKYDVYILTAYILKEDSKKSGIHLKNKYDYLYKTFPFLDPNKFIFTCDKSIVHGDIVIDDVKKNLYPGYETKILFTSYHNTNITDEELKSENIIRANNWKEIMELI